MSKQLDRYLETHPIPKSGGEQNQSPEERRALMTLRAEARKKGTHLASGGKGGLPSSLVLNVMRRDDYKCKLCGKREDIGIHHKGGIEESEWLKKKGHDNDPNNLVTICDECHDRIHEKARDEGVDSGG